MENQQTPQQKQSYYRTKFYNKADINKLLADVHAEILALKEVNKNATIIDNSAIVEVKYNWFGKLLLWLGTTR